MKEGRMFGLLLVVLAVLLILLDGLFPRRFSWEPSFAHDDHNPLGCAVFDDVANASLRHSYRVTGCTFSELLRDTALDSTATFLLAGESLALHEAEQHALLELVRRGHRLLLAGSNFSLSDTLYYRTVWPSYRPFSPDALAADADTLYWPEACGYYPAGRFVVGWHPSNTSIRLPDSLRVEVLLQTQAQSRESDTDGTVEAVAVRYHIGAGELTLVGWPVLFTNYAVLDTRYAPLTFRLLAQLDSGPVYRIDPGKTAEAAGGTSPLRYLLSRRPLRWALYTAFLTVLVFMFCSARRRQRVIPELTPPVNRNLEFVRLIGSLCFQQRDYADLLRKRYLYLRHFMREQVDAASENPADEAEAITRLARMAGMAPEEAESLLSELSDIENGKTAVDERRMKMLSDRINRILKQCK